MIHKDSSAIPAWAIAADKGPVANAFVRLGISHFGAAAQYIKELPYGRNADKTNLLTVFSDRKGTCSTKHALLRQLAIEHSQDNIRLMLGLFRMNAINTPAIAATLSRYGLDYIPEAHNYLLLDDGILDCTYSTSGARHFAADLLTEQQISPEQITAYKVQYQQAFLQQWLSDTGKNATFTPAEIWSVREQCIRDLSQ